MHCLVPKPYLRRRPQFNILQQMNNLRCSVIPKNTIQPFVVNVGKGWFIQQTGIHAAVLGQVADHLIDEPDLGGRVGGIVQELAEGLAGGFAIQPD